MPIFTFHLSQLGPAGTAGALLRPPTARSVPGLKHAECMAAMRLGAPLLSPGRYRMGRLAMFAAWEDEASLDAFLGEHALGRRLAEAWHVRLEFLRRWGRVAAFDDLPERAARPDTGGPVVAVTLARLRLLQVPRFIRWGKPVERLVRDHPGIAFAIAATRPPRTISTFTIWESARAMTDMVHGHGRLPAPRRHADAMLERERKDFHHEFTTLRFRSLGEHGVLEDRSSWIH